MSLGSFQHLFMHYAPLESDICMEVNIERPFHLRFDAIEFDEHIPSMRMQVAASIQQFGHRFEYQGGLWFACSAFDNFITSLASINTTEAKLVDMSSYFALLIRSVSGSREILWEMNRGDLIGEVTNISFRSPIDDDVLAHLKSGFNKIERWW